MKNTDLKTDIRKKERHVPFVFPVEIVRWDSIAKDKVRVLECLFDLQGSVGTPPNVITCKEKDKFWNGFFCFALS